MIIIMQKIGIIHKQTLIKNKMIIKPHLEMKIINFKINKKVNLTHYLMETIMQIKLNKIIHQQIK